MGLRSGEWMELGAAIAEISPKNGQQWRENEAQIAELA